MVGYFILPEKNAFDFMLFLKRFVDIQTISTAEI